MKQHITEEQWNELTKEQQDKFIKSVPECGSYTDVDWFEQYAITIGQMIEFLLENNPVPYLTENYEIFRLQWFADENICDKLWEAVKEVLNENR